jgi:hypothetical protein
VSYRNFGSGAPVENGNTDTLDNWEKQERVAASDTPTAVHTFPPGARPEKCHRQRANKASFGFALRKRKKRSALFFGPRVACVQEFDEPKRFGLLFHQGMWRI